MFSQRQGRGLTVDCVLSCQANQANGRKLLKSLTARVCRESGANCRRRQHAKYIRVLIGKSMVSANYVISGVALHNRDGREKQSPRTPPLHLSLERAHVCQRSSHMNYATIVHCHCCITLRRVIIEVITTQW